MSTTIADYHPERIQRRLIATLKLLRDRFVERVRLRQITSDLIEQYKRDTTEAIFQARRLAQLAGWLSPWFPSLYGPDVDAPDALPDLVEGGRVRALDLLDTPIASVQIDEAYKFLDRQLVDFPSTWGGLVTREQLAAQVGSQRVTGGLLNRLNRELTESVKSGESADQWRERISGVVDLPDHTYEAVSRTASHRSFHQGKAAVLNQRGVREAFPYRRYWATLDNRVRAEHRALHGKVYHRDSSLAAEAAYALSDWNCRCSETPLGESEAVAAGISEGGEPPEGLAAAVDVIDDQFAGRASEDSKAAAGSVGKSQEAERQALALQRRLDELDPFKFGQEERISQPLTVSAVTRQIDGTHVVTTRESDAVIELTDADPPKPGDVVAFEVKPEDQQPERVPGVAPSFRAAKVIKKYVSVVMVGLDRSGRNAILGSSGSKLPTEPVLFNETPADAAGRAVARAGVQIEGLIAVGKYANQGRNPDSPDEWFYSYVARVRTPVETGDGSQWLPVAEAIGGEWAGDHGLQLTQALRTLVRLTAG